MALNPRAATATRMTCVAASGSTAAGSDAVIDRPTRNSANGRSSVAKAAIVSTMNGCENGCHSSCESSPTTSASTAMTEPAEKTTIAGAARLRRR